MPRVPRRMLAAPYFHVTNRSVRKKPIFRSRTDYRAFLLILREGLERYAVRLVAYCVLSNHWHMVVEPAGTKDLTAFMRWVTATHAIRWHKHHKSVGTGPVYQGRFWSEPVESAGGPTHDCADG